MDAGKRRWFNSEIPLWGVLTFIAFPAVAWLVNLEFRVRTVEAGLLSMKPTYESVGRMAWQVEGMASMLKEMKKPIEDMKSQNSEILLIQRDIAEIQCRTGGRCSDMSPRKVRQ